MRRHELVVGAELYLNRSWNWLAGFGEERKAIVVQTRPFRRDQREPFTIRPVASGSGVYVVFDDGQPDVVHLAHLRGPWAEVHEQLAAVKDTAKAHRATAAEVRLHHFARARRLIDRARQLGVPASVRNAGPVTAEVALSIDAFEALIQRLEATQ